MKCVICGGKAPSKNLPVCPNCAKKDEVVPVADDLHRPWSDRSVEKCSLCSNECRSIALCGRPPYGSLSYYEDPLPTNCCNSWFCCGSEMHGTNLAVFYYGCNFDCLYCQNWTHKLIDRARIVPLEELMEAAMIERVKCVCHFGGSPEPQLPFAIRFSRRVLEERDELMICWEWNGAGNRNLAMKAAELSWKSRGTVKFDLKAWNVNLHRVLTGRDNGRVLENFTRIAERYLGVVSATTLLVPYYVDEEEVENIARFISDINPDIPYSLLVFHPDYRLRDLPVTPLAQVRRCYEAAKKHLNRVSIGNLHLLGI